MGSLTAVYALTSDLDWKSKYDITIYHMGWRLGGKGASGRNGSPAKNGLVSQRIEEHGLHLWFGFYDNAFDLIQQCYTDNGREWGEAFKGYDTICLEEKIEGQWLHWPITVPSNGLTPGIGGILPTIGEYVYKLLEWMKGNHDTFQTQKSDEVKARIKAHKDSEHMTLIRNLMQGITMKGEEAFEDAGSFLLRGALELAKVYDHFFLFEVLGRLKEWIEIIGKGLLMSDKELRRYFIMADLGIVTIRGMIADGVITGGFDKINDVDYRGWLEKHGAAQVTLNSAIVQAVYGLVFGGDRQYTFEAGTALRGFLRLGLTYKGHIYYRMTTGMGDAIFTPMYEVLKKRGVNFEFFNKVTNLGLSNDKKSIATISIDVQATIKPPYPFYDPLVNVKEQLCWPSEPIYEQLVQGDDLKNQNVNLESYYSTWRPVQSKTLNANSDFDIVLLGISIGALPTITKELTSDAWKNMLKNVIPISTIAFQVWLKSSIAQMGWPFTSLGLALVGSYQEPYDTWADMSDLIDRENWPQGYEPKNIAYFCGPTPQPNADEILKNAQTGNFGNPGFPYVQTRLAKDNALEYLNELTQHIWPGLWNPGQKSFDFNQLIDLNNGLGGTAQFDAQFFRANIDPTELYVMSFTNSSQHRIKTDETGYENLYITGDWIDCGFNAGCIEATVMSGKQAARAISGGDIDIPGEKDL